MVPLDAPPLARPRAAPPPPTSVAVPPVLPNNAILFSPVSLFGLYASVEYERRLTTQVTAFASFGAGAVGQLGFDIGARLYPVDHAFESFFADARLSGFALTQSLFLLGPMVELGYSWRIRSVLLSVGAGAVMWQSVFRAGRGILSRPVIDAALFTVPGFFQPPIDQVGLQPTIRLTIGPVF